MEMQKKIIIINTPKRKEKQEQKSKNIENIEDE